MGKATVSIVIAASAAPQQIGACLRSLAAQTLGPDEIIISGAHNRLDLPALRRLASASAIPVRVHAHSEMPYFAHDLNAALPLARADYTSFINANQAWSGDVLATLAAATGECAWSYGGAALPNDIEGLADLVERGHAIDALLIPGELADHLAPLDPALTPCERWDIALQLMLLTPGRRVQLPASADTGAAPNVDCAAQILRKHTIRLKTRLANFADSARRSLATVAQDPESAEAAGASLSLPYLERRAPAGAELAFLVSAPRSGSTLLQRILAVHPDIHTLPEPWVMLNPCHALRESGVEADYEPALAARALNGFLEQTGGGELYTDAVRCMTDRLYGAALHGSGARLFLDKTPRYFHILPELRAIYPGAQLIFLLRHPLAVVASALDTWFDGDVDAFRENKNALDCVTGPRRIMKMVTALGDAAVCLHYEKLVANPEAEIRRLCQLLGIGFDERMLHYAATPLAESEFGDQRHITRHDHAVADYADRWRERYHTDERLSLAHEVLDQLGSDLFIAMGYDYDEAKALLAAAAAASALPPCADALTHEGESRFAAGDLDGAEALFRGAIDVQPAFSLAHNNLGVLHATRGDNDEAVDCFIRALTLEPAGRDAMINLIECAGAANRLGDTLTSLAAYLEATPDDPEVVAMARQITEVLDHGAANAAPEQIPSLPRGPEILVPGEVPRISIVTPSYNQGEYLEACIDSILSQNYPNLDYLIMDGGSTDQSVAIIQRYQKYLSHWQSGKDDGQYAAIEAGLKRSDGEIMAWLNSDDKYHPDALWKVSYAFMTRPQVEWLTGLYTFWDDRGTLTGVLDPIYWTQAQQLDPADMRTVQQESTFWRRSLWDKAGGRLATELYYAGDWDLWTRYFAHAELHTLEWTIGGYRYHEGQKVGNDASGYTAEANELLERERARLEQAGSLPRDNVPAPIRYQDADLIELRTWRESSLPAQRYVSKTSSRPGKQRPARAGGREQLPSVDIVTSLDREPGANDAAVESWLAAGWHVVSVNNTDVAGELQTRYPAVEVVTTNDVAALREEARAVTFRAILAEASARSSDVIGIIQPDIIIANDKTLTRGLAGAAARTLFYGDKYSVNSTAVLDGIVDGYSYVFCSPQSLARFNPGQLTFSHEWWLHWTLMMAIAEGFTVQKITEPHAYRIKQPCSTPYDEQVLSSKACIASVLARYLPAEFGTIPSLKLSFDIESSDFEKFARSFVASRAA